MQLSSVTVHLPGGNAREDEGAVSMTALHIADIKGFMNLLFTAEAFDRFQFVEGEISTAIDYKLSGRVNFNFYSEEELEQLKSEEYQEWGATKPIITQMIKGKRLPVSMKFVLKKAGKGDLTYLLNIRYENNNLVIITGVSRSVFTMDKSGEKEWDDNVKAFLNRNGVNYEEME